MKPATSLCRARTSTVAQRRTSNAPATANNGIPATMNNTPISDILRTSARYPGEQYANGALWRKYRPATRAIGGEWRDRRAENAIASRRKKFLHYNARV